jgi:hypothetical protein
MWPRLVRRSGIAAAVVLVAAVAVIGTHAVTGWMTRLLKTDPLWELLDWTDVRNEVIRRGWMNDNLFFAGLAWHASGKLGYALGPAATVYCLCADPHQFGLDQDLAAARGQNGVVAVEAERLNASLPEIRAMFESVEATPPVPLLRGNVPSNWIVLVRGTGFKPPAKFH